MFKRKRRKRRETNTVVVLENYHTLKQNVEYPVVAEGIDWYLVKSHGKCIYIFKNLVE